MDILNFITEPFADYAFMRRALVAGVVLAMSGVPLGVLMSLRRMTLLGDAVSHAILPGIAVAFLAFGVSLWPMTLGGLIAGVLMAFLALLLTRLTQLKEDAAFSMLYLVSLAFGVTLIAVKGNSIDLFHLLFGNILAIDNESLGLVVGVCCVTLLVFAGAYRRFVIDCFDPDFLKSSFGVFGKSRSMTSILFFSLLVLNLVASFQALGTLMALGLFLLPSIAARFWTANIDRMIPLAVLMAIFCVFSGLVVSYFTRAPAGPSVVLACGAVALFSAIFGRYGSVVGGLRGRF